MKKTIFIILAVVCVVAVCCVIFVDNHQCEWATEWTYDVQYHWHECVVKKNCEQVNDKSEHTLVNKYSADGTKQWQECACGYKSAEVTHTHTGGNATCTAKAICTACGQQYGEVLGHDYKAVVTAPTCTEQGYTTHTCSRCNDSYVDSQVDAIGHNYATATYVWANDNSSCVATRVCVNDSTHVESVTGNVTFVVTQTQSTTQVELTAYTATFTESWATEQNKEVQTKDVLGVAKVKGVGYETIAQAITNAESGDTITILEGGTYSMPVTSGSGSLTFAGSKDVIFEINNRVGSVTTISFEGLTLKFKSDNYIGFEHASSISFTDCYLMGTQCVYAQTAQFTNCTFENKEYWSVWTYGANNVTFTNCTFNTGGHAVLIYNEQTSINFVANVTMNGCTFNNDGSVEEPWGHEDLVETGSNAPNAENSNVYNLTFDDCKIVGSDKQKLWGNKNSLDQDHLNVVIDDVDVY